MSWIRIISLVLITCVLAGCGGSQKKFATAPDKPAQAPFNDPGDHILKQEMQKFLKSTGSPLHSQYEFSRLDLDSDGRRDALVLLKTPYGYWCGLHGCTLLIMKATNDNFVLVNAVQPIRAPLRVSEFKTNGWKNLITRVSGRNQSAKNVALQFNGQGYPSDPSDLPPYATLAEKERSVKVFP